MGPCELETIFGRVGNAEGARMTSSSRIAGKWGSRLRSRRGTAVETGVAGPSADLIGGVSHASEAGRIN
jgi:hypothetical protein